MPSEHAVLFTYSLFESANRQNRLKNDIAFDNTLSTQHCKKIGN